MTSEWHLVIFDHAEYRGERMQYVYDPCVFPDGENIQSPMVRYCNHRHTSYDAAKRCGDRLRRRAMRGLPE